jgi:hypothetical protein
MARMIPPYISDDVRSAGERRIFDLLRKDPDTSNWVALHSLGLAKHIAQQDGELDFVVLVPGEGYFVWK